MRKSIKRRMSVLAGAFALCVLVGALVALPASAHIVAGVDATCDAVTVHFKYFPDNPIPVTIAVQVGSEPLITSVVNVRTTQDESVSIASSTADLHGTATAVTVDVTWTLFGDNHVHETRWVTCGTSGTSSTTTTSTTNPTVGPRGNIFEVELRRCGQVLTGYNNFPAGTIVRWKVLQDGQTFGSGHLVAQSGSNHHFVTQSLDLRLKASPVLGDVHYFWTIKGIDYHYFVRREPGCSGTTSTGASGPGNLFVVTLHECHVLDVGYNFFPADVVVVWVVKQGAQGRFGAFTTTSGSEYHFLTHDLGLMLKGTSKASVTLHWTIKTNQYHYAITRSTVC